MIAPEEIQGLPQVRKAIWKRQNKRSQILLAEKGREPYVWRFKKNLDQHLQEIESDLKSLFEYKRAAMISELRHG